MGDALVAQRVAGQRVSQLRHRADVAGVQFVDRHRRLALHGRDVRELFGAAAGEVLQRGVVLQHAGKDLEERDATGEGIADGLEDVQRKRLGVADLADCGLAVVRRGSGGDRAALNRRRHVVHDEVEHLVGADVAQSGGKEHREDLVFANGVVQTADNVLLGDGALVEELFHQHVVAFGNQFHQALVRGLGLLGHVVGNRSDLGLAVAAHLVGVGLHLHQVDYAGEALLRADGQLHRNHGAAES